MKQGQLPEEKLLALFPHLFVHARSTHEAVKHAVKWMLRSLSQGLGWDGKGIAALYELQDAAEAAVEGDDGQGDEHVAEPRSWDDFETELVRLLGQWTQSGVLLELWAKECLALNAAGCTEDCRCSATLSSVAIANAATEGLFDKSELAASGEPKSGRNCADQSKPAAATPESGKRKRAEKKQPERAKHLKTMVANALMQALRGDGGEGSALRQRAAQALARLQM